MFSRSPQSILQQLDHIIATWLVFMMVFGVAFTTDFYTVAAASGGGGAGAGITITGTLYENDGITPITAAKTIVAAVGTSTVSLHSTTTAADGSFSISGIATSTLGTWATTTASAVANSIYDITYNNGVFVAASQFTGDSLSYSYDGISWNPATYSEGPNPKSVTYGNGVFVAVLSGWNWGGPERVLVSKDGISWEPVSAAEDDDSWQSITYGNGQFVAVGAGGDDRVMYSDDGYNWTTVSAAGDNDQWYSVAYGNDRFVATSYNSGDEVMYSTDAGESWTTGTLDSGSWETSDFGGGVFMAFAWGSATFATSTDGATWTYGTAPFSAAANSIDNIEYANGTFFVSNNCANGTVNDCLFYTSDAGATWDSSTVLATSSFRALGYGNGRLIMMDPSSSEDIVQYADAGFGEDTPITLFVDENATTSSSTATTLTYGVNPGATTTITADLIADTVLLTKTASASSTTNIHLSDADMYDSTDDSDILFTATTSTTTVAADLRIVSGTTVYAPQNLVIDGDLVIASTTTLVAPTSELTIAGALTQNGSFTARGTTTLAGTGETFYLDGASYTDTLSVAAQENFPTGLAFNPDGTKLYVVGTEDDAVDEWALSTPYDVSTGVYTDTLVISAQENIPNGIAFNAAGTTLYVVGIFS